MLINEFIKAAIEHHGIKGMKWGVRRKRGSSGRVSSDYKTSRKISKKKLSQMTNEDLKKLNTRMQLERTASSVNPSAKAKGKQLFSRALNTYESALIASVAGSASAATVALAIKLKG